ncbi:MAG: CAP domain-containing protein [Gammaproteobacteria bacterium]|nr:CAP domain-containing protein [Gammaproteobacteria bacterium]
MKLKPALNNIIILSCLILFSVTHASPQTNNDRILADINTYRGTHGLHKLEMNSYISEIAAVHSQRMAANQVTFGHGGYQQRMDQLFHQFPHAHGFAENVAFTYLPSTSVATLWLQSPGHRKNIEGNFNMTGIGTAYDQNGHAYVTQIFLRVQ